MDSLIHRFSDLFAQLGLPSEPPAIAAFILAHRPLPEEYRLEEAPFWSEAQAQLLSETIVEDADWAEVVDHLNAALRA